MYIRSSCEFNSTINKDLFDILFEKIGPSFLFLRFYLWLIILNKKNCLLSSGDKRHTKQIYKANDQNRQSKKETENSLS